MAALERDMADRDAPKRSCNVAILLSIFEPRVRGPEADAERRRDRSEAATDCTDPELA